MYPVISHTNVIDPIASFSILCGFAETLQSTLIEEFWQDYRKCIFCLTIKIAPDKPYFGKETGYHERNFVAHLIFEQNANY